MPKEPPRWSSMSFLSRLWIVMVVLGGSVVWLPPLWCLAAYQQEQQQQHQQHQHSPNDGTNGLLGGAATSLLHSSLRSSRTTTTTTTTTTSSSSGKGCSAYLSLHRNPSTSTNGPTTVQREDHPSSSSSSYPRQPVSDRLPRRYYVIYGLESSGTRFVAETIARALKLPPFSSSSTSSTSSSFSSFSRTGPLPGRSGSGSDVIEWDDDPFHHVQRIPLPWKSRFRSRKWIGMDQDDHEDTNHWDDETKDSSLVPPLMMMIPVLHPTRCYYSNTHPPTVPTNGTHPTNHSSPAVTATAVRSECRAFMDDEESVRWPRVTHDLHDHHHHEDDNNNDDDDDDESVVVFVNMTTHIRWYRERGVQVYPIMVVRDPSLHFTSLLSKNRPPTAMTTKKKKGRAAWNSTTTSTTPRHDDDDVDHDHHHHHHYEVGRAIMADTMAKGLNPIVVSYETLMTLRTHAFCQLYESLGIESDYIPNLKNGNIKYLQKKKTTTTTATTTMTTPQGNDDKVGGGKDPASTNQREANFEPVELDLMKEDD